MSTDNLKTLYEIIKANWVKAGNTGEPSEEFIRKWRMEKPQYGVHTLGTRFRSGSANPVRPWTLLDQATAEFRRRHPGATPDGEEFERVLEEFEKLAELDERTTPRTRYKRAQDEWHRRTGGTWFNPGPGWAEFLAEFMAKEPEDPPELREASFEADKAIFNGYPSDS